MAFSSTLNRVFQRDILTASRDILATIVVALLQKLTWIIDQKLAIGYCNVLMPADEPNILSRHFWLRRFQN